ncbi:MAG: hypothetical protein ACRDJL_04195 [Actinomycetota bacterium]
MSSTTGPRYVIPALNRPLRAPDVPAEVRSARRIHRLVVLSLVALVVSAWALAPALRSELSTMIEMVARGRVDALGERLASYGALGPLISLGIMVIQGSISLSQPLSASSPKHCSAYLGHAAEDQAPLVMGVAFAIALLGLAATLVVGRPRRARGA